MGAEHLTERHRTILTLIAEGMTNRQIAAELYLAEKTVKNYVSDILRTLGVNNRAAAAVEAVRIASSDDGRLMAEQAWDRAVERVRQTNPYRPYP